MRVEQGGTQKWCPSCQAVTVCTAVNPSRLGVKSGQRWYLKDHTDIQWFRDALFAKLVAANGYLLKCLRVLLTNWLS